MLLRDAMPTRAFDDIDAACRFLLMRHDADAFMMRSLPAPPRPRIMFADV